MDWLTENWQSIAAGAIVGLTVMVFLRRLAKRPKPGCGGKCGCGKR